MIVVTGATGQLGGAIVERLLERVPAQQVGLSTREPEKVQALRARGVRVRPGDYADAASLRHAFEGASQVLLVSANVVGPAAAQLHRTAIEAARAVGVRRILYTSHMGANPASLFSPMTTHAATEELLRASGGAFTSLRNGYYAASAVMLMGQALETGKLVAPEDGPVSWTAHADLAEATVLALIEEGRLDGVSPALTGSEALDLAAIARIASELTGRTITRVTVSDAEYRAGMISRGVPAHAADMLGSIFTASRRGEFAAVDPTLERLLGRRPQSFRDYLAATLRR